MFIVLYRWRIKPGFEDQFADAWSAITRYYVENFNSLGSRLHRGNDGLWYAYAQWESAEQRENAFSESRVSKETSRKMREGILERFPEVILETFVDYLKYEK